MEEVINVLKSLHGDIERVKRERATIDGRQSEILRQLKETFGVSSIKEAEDLLRKYKKDIDTLDKKIKSKFTALTKAIAGSN